MGVMGVTQRNLYSYIQHKLIFMPFLHHDVQNWVGL